jgi:hypothetical protein
MRSTTSIGLYSSVFSIVSHEISIFDFGTSFSESPRKAQVCLLFNASSGSSRSPLPSVARRRRSSATLRKSSSRSPKRRVSRRKRSPSPKPTCPTTALILVSSAAAYGALAPP